MRRRSEKGCRDLMGLKQRGHCAVDRYGARVNHIVRAQAQCERKADQTGRSVFIPKRLKNWTVIKEE